MFYANSLGLFSMITGIEEGFSSQATSDMSPLDPSESLMANANNFGVYQMSAQKPLNALPQCGNLNISLYFQSDAAPNQRSPHLDT